MTKPIIGIIGFGIVGRALHHGFSLLADFRIFDINPLHSENSFENVIKDSEFIFICVPTPSDKDTGECKVNLIDDIFIRSLPLAENTNKIFIIKSTCIPGTTESFNKKYPKLNIIFNPEFLTERSYKLDFINASRIILGGNPELIDRVAELYASRFPMTPICLTDATTAEAAKYFSNVMLSAKVGLCNEFYDISQSLGIDYDEVINLVLMDGRIGKSHVDVPGHDGERGWGGLCFPKDLKSLIHKSDELGVNNLILKSVWESNLKIRKKKDWLDKKGAFE